MTAFHAEVRRYGAWHADLQAFLAAARDRGCRYQIGSDMLFEQIPAYLEFFGLPTTTPDNLRSVAQLAY